MKRTKEEQRLWRIEHRDQIQEQKKRYREKNKERISIQVKEFHAKNPHKVLEYRIKELYGLTLEQYNEIKDSQDGKCAICKRPTESFKRGLYVDHNHTTKKVRGLLCSKCNTFLWYINDDVDALKRACEHLEKGL